MLSDLLALKVNLHLTSSDPSICKETEFHWDF